MSRLQHLAINEEGFIFDPLTGESFTTNKTGVFILKRLQEGKSEDKILEELVEEFDVSREVAERDLIDFIQKLRSFNLI
jgi:PqqD family protein of HPr-rel-A system